MFKKLSMIAISALILSGGAAHAAGGAGKVKDTDFSFEGPFGTFDENQLQRGLQVYTEICAGCHSLQYVPFRTLADEGGPHLPKDQMRAYADQNFEVWDPELADGDGDFRPAKPTDNFPAVTGQNAPDLSLMAKARAGFHGPYGTGINQFLKGMGGPEYIVSVLTGYTGNEKEEAGSVFYENTAFPGGWIAMAPPLYGEDVEYADGHANDIKHEAEDIAAFLMWTAEPKLMDRKQAGLTGFLFLSLLAVLLFFTNKRLWSAVKGRKKA